ncbi:MAG: hypothetical protein EXR95_07180, partial [Gemmatimonadetes bacterium]|nr:hypothetical protein [Gemmatimonadota bacterium]
MSAGVCARCGAAASGKFCAECGASLAPLTCPACGHVPLAGSRFCTQCGAPVAGQALPPLAGGDAVARADSQLPWWIAGGTLVLLIILLAWPVIHPKEPEPAAP